VRYETPQAFERALSDRLKRQAAEEGVDLDRLRKRVAFEKFLARLFEQTPAHWVLKGGYALELRLGGRARATRDVDLDRPPPPAEDLLDELQKANGRISRKPSVARELTVHKRHYGEANRARVLSCFVRLIAVQSTVLDTHYRSRRWPTR